MSAGTKGEFAAARLDDAQRAIDAGRHGEALSALRTVALSTEFAAADRDRARIAAMQVAARMYDLATMVELRDLELAGSPPSERAVVLLGLVADALDGSPVAVRRLIAEVNARLDGHLPGEELRMIAESLALAIARSGHGDEFFDVLLRVAGMSRDLGEEGLVTSLLIAEAAYRSRSNLRGACLVAQRAVDMASAEDDLRNLPFALAQLTTARASLGEASFAQSADHLEAFGAAAAVLVADFARAMHALTVGVDDEAYERFRRIDARFSGDLTAPVSWHADLVDLALARGERDVAVHVAHSLGTAAAACSIPWLTAASARVGGALSADAATSARSFEVAVSAYEEHGYAIAAARTRLSHARWMRQHGGDPRPMLDVARRLFDEAGMACWSQKCA